MKSHPVALAVIILLSAFQFTLAETNWPRWRGPLQNGHSNDEDLPVAWGESDVVWKAPLRGAGYSTPVIWGDRIYLTTALKDGQQRVVLCVDRNLGEILWEKVAWKGEPEPVHAMSGWANSSCVTDGERVYAFFGRGGGLFCYSVDGELIWSKNLGQFEGPWGTAASPVLVGDLVIQNCDADSDSCIVAFDKKTGEEKWRTERDQTRGWSTPVLIQANGRDELVLNGDRGVRGYDPTTGKELWYCKSFNGRGEPTATLAHGLLFISNGKEGDFYAVKPGGNGDVTKTHMAWHTARKGGRDMPSPIVIDDYVMMVNMGGIATCYDALSGNEIWKARLGGAYTASPIAFKGLAFFINEAGETSVVKPGPQLEVVEENTVGGSPEELFRAALTPSDGQLFVRSDKNLYCIGNRASGSN